MDLFTLGEALCGIKQGIRTKESFKSLNLKVNKLWTLRVETFIVLLLIIKDGFILGVEVVVLKIRDS